MVMKPEKRLKRAWTLLPGQFLQPMVQPDALYVMGEKFGNPKITKDGATVQRGFSFK